MKHSLWIPTALSATILAACGGGSSDTSATGTGPVTATALTLRGVAATGAAIVGRTVDAKCATGTGSATSNTDGSYTVTVTSGSLPCLVKITPATGPTLYSMATGTGSSATANINPVTQLVVASLTGTDPDAYFTGFDGTAAAPVTNTKVGHAVSAVKTLLLPAGVDLGAIDVLAGTLTPATGTTAGNAYDQALDALAAKLASTGTTLAALTTMVAVTSPTAPATSTATGVASLPAALLLKAAATNYAALRSGVYRVVHPDTGKLLATQTSQLSMNAATLAVIDDFGTPQASNASWVANGNCRYLADSGKSDTVVSPAGVIVARYFDATTTTTKLALAIPEQTHALAELEGSWNTLGLSCAGVSIGYVGNTVTGTISATGTLSAASVCQNSSPWSVTTCIAKTSDFPTFAANADGGFDVLDVGTTVASGRTFAYRAGGGDLMMVRGDGDGSLEVRTRARTGELPAVGRVSISWDVIVTRQLLATPAITESTNTVTAVDTAAGSFARLAKTVGGADERLETVSINNPRGAYNFRATAAVVGTSGSVINVSEWTNLGLRSMGLNALVRPAQKQLMFSVQQPS